MRPTRLYRPDLTLLDLLVDVLLSSVGLPARISRSLAAIAMLVAGLTFLAMAIFMAVEAVGPQALGPCILSGLFLALSFGSFWLMYRAAREQGKVMDEA